MTEDRRNEGRALLLLHVEWEGASGKSEARTSDLSSGGCFVDTMAQVLEGEALNFKIMLPGGDVVVTKGVVTYAYPNIGFGIRFSDMSDEDKFKLETILESKRD